MSNTQETERVVIKPEELRVGNWINDVKGRGYNNPGFAQVKTIGSSGVNQWQDMSASGCAKYEDIEPIPLSPEILEKAKLRMEGKCYVYDYNEGYDSLYFEFSNMANGFLLNLICAQPIIGRDIKTLHHFQNLIFDLTGEELIINL